ncbi:MAG: ATP-binding protein [Phycisphaerae bacterium]
MRSRSFQTDQSSLQTSIRTAQESIRQRLHATRDHLTTLAEDMAREAVSQELFAQRLAHYMGEHPELVSAMYVDAEGKARWAVPGQWEEKVLGRPLACPRSLEVCQEARKSLRPVYSNVHISLQNEPAFDLCIPIHDKGRALGSIVAVYSCERILRNMLSRETVHEHRASVVDADGNIIVALPAVSRLDERLYGVAALDPPGQGLFLKLDRYGSGFWGIGMTLLVILCIGLAVGMSWGIWSLNRQVQRRLEAERMLREANESLSERVRERTADLETANRQLQQEIVERQHAQEDSRLHQEELAHVARVSTMGEMATGLAHELNQPLGAIASFADGSLRLMESNKATPEALQAALTEVSEQARRAGKIIHRLRSFVATGEPRRERHSLKKLAEELVDLVAADLRQEQIDFHLDLPESLPAVLVDGIQTQQVLLNIIRNAIEALQHIEATRRRIDVTAKSGSNGTVELLVADTGPGCSADLLRQMFDAFFTTKRSGIGMGLSISRSIVEAHGGKIWAAANATGGLTVGFTMPTVEGEHDVECEKA